MFLNRQQGFLLPAALFLLVIMLLLAGAIVRISSESARGSVQELLSVRAFYAAESGANWALGRMFYPPGNGASTNGVCNSTIDGQTINFTHQGLNTCSVTLSCQSTPLSGSNEFFYRITAQGDCGAGQLSASRTVQVQAKL